MPFPPYPNGVPMTGFNDSVLEMVEEEVNRSLAEVGFKLNLTFNAKFTTSRPFEVKINATGTILNYPLDSYKNSLEDKAKGDWIAGHRKYGIDINDRCRIVKGKKKGESFMLYSISSSKAKDIKKPFIVKKLDEMNEKPFTTYKMSKDDFAKSPDGGFVYLSDCDPNALVVLASDVGSTPSLFPTEDSSGRFRKKRKKDGLNPAQRKLAASLNDMQPSLKHGMERGLEHHRLERAHEQETAIVNGKIVLASEAPTLGMLEKVRVAVGGGQPEVKEEVTEVHSPLPSQLFDGGVFDDNSNDEEEALLGLPKLDNKKVTAVDLSKLDPGTRTKAIEEDGKTPSSNLTIDDYDDDDEDDDYLV